MTSPAYLYLDTETFCATPIKDGTYRYAEDVEIMLFQYAYDDEPVQVVDLTKGDIIPDSVVDDMTNPVKTKVFHNSAFDRNVIRSALGVDIPVDQIHDTMIQALAHALPGSLAKLCEVMGVALEDSKHATGKNLINLFCKPTPKNWKVRRATRETHPDEWQAFVDYADSDVRAMRSLLKKLPMWNYRGFERRLWVLDQHINDRGFAVDVDLAEKAIIAVDRCQELLSEDMSSLTGGEVQRATQRDKLLEFLLKTHGYKLENMRKSTLETCLNDPNLSQGVKDLLVTRQKASTTSTAKYKTLIRSTSADGRLRGTLQYDGASRTRRWAGRLFQPQNLPRPTHKQNDIDFAIKAIKAGCIDLIDHDDVMGLTSSCIRGSITASEGKKLYVSDLSNIEGRKGAWYANETWKLKAFRDFDNGEGHDLYKLAYAKAFGTDPAKVTKDERQIGKVLELSMQYAGGVGAFLTFALAYGIDLDKLAAMVWDNLPENTQDDALDFYKWQVSQKRSTYELEKKTFCAMDGLKRLWRDTHPQIVSLWALLEESARNAVENPGREFTARRVTFVRKGAWLRCILPSGASLCYPSPKIVNGSITYMGVNQYTRKWERLTTYGGKLLENICQSSSRDVMAWRMFDIETAGYEILLTVHDELITEGKDDGTLSHEGLSEILATPPVWCEDLPLDAGGFEDYRYRKD